ncbi:MAG: Flp pilus assembly complex ATPase component TadA [Desulfovibrio sp.]|jgi:twitching motility protein PilT|nr:Flp pilus assembly complex ATPase component TadA [Desulfovibrio sp.]
MSLADIEFSDLLLLPDGTAKLKDGAGSPLRDLPDDCRGDVENLSNLLLHAVLEKKHSTLRYTHMNVRYRVAGIKDLDGRQAWFLRRQPETVPPLTAHGLPPYLLRWLISPEQRQGLILYSGAQSAGKTTIASSYVADRLTRYGGHAVTFENPAELPLSGPWGNDESKGYCFQLEIQSEAELPHCIEQAHRYASPDIIYIGEIRTKYAALESLRVALGSSRQIVVATIHGLNVITALDRLLTWAREVDGENACQNLSNALLAVIHVQISDIADGQRAITSPEHMLLPFKEHCLGVRQKLREGKINMLGDDMRALKNRIAAGGEDSI